jgi:SAM-dependent methyltransferase
LYFEHAPEVYNLGHKRKLDLQGWNMYPRLYSQLLKQANAQLVVEVGVWKGASSINFAQWLKARGHGVVVAVDTWLGALEFWERDTPGNTLMPEKDLSWRHGYPSVYYTFLSNVLHKKVQDYVIPFPVPSRLAADYLARRNILADFIHVDGGHTYQDAKEDIALWWRILRPGGIMIGDDYTYWPGVKQAVDEFVKEQGLTLKRYKIKWWVQKPPTKTD